MTEKIAIVTNTIEPRLYIKSASLFMKAGFDHIKIPGENGLYGLQMFYYLIENYDYDWVIYLDEDCFIFNIFNLFELLKHQIDNNIDCSGMPDGGVISHRDYNPVSINPYFTILNLKKLREKYNKKEINNTKWGVDLKKFSPIHLFKKEFDESLYPTMIKLPKRKAFGVKYRDKEPYYKLFFWMLRNDFNFLYLDAYNIDKGDEFTTVLKNHENKDFAFHTWYARQYNKHKKRIDRIYKLAHEIHNN